MYQEIGVEFIRIALYLRLLKEKKYHAHLIDTHHLRARGEEKDLQVQAIGEDMIPHLIDMLEEDLHNTEEEVVHLMGQESPNKTICREDPSIHPAQKEHTRPCLEQWGDSTPG